MKRLAAIAMLGALALPGAFAQNEIPPDVKAYREAARETDPEKKIADLEKWKADFPETQMRSTADREILNTLARKLPDRQDRIRKHAAAMYKAVAEKAKGQIALQIATELLEANVLLPEARKYAQKSVDAWKLAPYLEEQLAGYEKRKQTPPSTAELRKRFDATRASRLALLGRIEVRLGHTARAKKLLEESYSADATNAVVQGELGVLAAKAGDDPKALELLIPAKLSGRASRDAAQAFETVYKRQHNGSLDGADALLDAEYRKRFPNPLKLERYTPAEKRSDRVVLAEVFTGAGCGPCAAADLAFEAAMERYSRKELAVVMYHVHVPRPDPMTTADTPGISKAYGVSGVPTFFIDGKKFSGGGTRQMANSTYERFSEDIRKGLETPAEARITAAASLKGRTVEVNARVHDVKSESKDLKVEIALVEKELRYNGENGIRFHPMVVRAIKSFPLSGETYQHSFDVDAVSKAIKDHLDDYESKGHRGESFQFLEKKDRIDANDLAVVVFVHDDKTRHVLQSAHIEFGSAAPQPTSEASNDR